jgi:thiol-disulfide isomerase/thioredoxin
MNPPWRAPAGLHTATLRLPVEGELPPLDGASGWVNSPPLTPADVRGKVVLASFWTYTCINRLRQLPYLRAWAAKYAGNELVVIGVHTPEFPFEHSPNNVRQAVTDMGIAYPVALDNDYAIWRAFANHYWPALYFADGQGQIRHHHFGEGEYLQSEMVIQQLLTDAGSGAIDREMVSVTAEGIEAPADWGNLRSPENYLGYERTENFASTSGILSGQPHLYAAPAQLRRNEWALSGDWTIDEQATTLNSPDGRIAYRFHARDLHLVMAPAAPGAAMPFRVLIDGVRVCVGAGADVREPERERDLSNRLRRDAFTLRVSSASGIRRPWLFLPRNRRWQHAYAAAFAGQQRASAVSPGGGLFPVVLVSAASPHAAAKSP